MGRAKIWRHKRWEVRRTNRGEHRSVRQKVHSPVSCGLRPTYLRSDHLDRHKLAIVCSARSGSTKSLGTTNLLLRAASEALQRAPQVRSPVQSGTATPLITSLVSRCTRTGSPPDTTDLLPDHCANDASSFNKTVDLIHSEHIAAARGCVKGKEILSELEAEIGRDCENLRAFLFAAQVCAPCIYRLFSSILNQFGENLQVIDEISPKSKDSIVGFGEKLGCKIIAATLRDHVCLLLFRSRPSYLKTSTQGIDAEYVSLENVVPPYDGVDSTLGQDFYDLVGTAFARRVRQCGPRVPVVTGSSLNLPSRSLSAHTFSTGFFGPVPGSLLKQVGRGYTDLAAALLAAGLGASELQIWKEVDGIFTADPRKVLTARLLPVISPEEAAELTYYGSEVVHPFTMEQARTESLPPSEIFSFKKEQPILKRGLSRLSGEKSRYASRTSRTRAAGARSSTRRPIRRPIRCPTLAPRSSMACSRARTSTARARRRRYSSSSGSRRP